MKFVGRVWIRGVQQSKRVCVSLFCKRRPTDFEYSGKKTEKILRIQRNRRSLDEDERIDSRLTSLDWYQFNNFSLLPRSFWANDHDGQFTDNLLQQANEWLLVVSRGRGRFVGHDRAGASLCTIRFRLLRRLSVA